MVFNIQFQYHFILNITDVLTRIDSGDVSLITKALTNTGFGAVSKQLYRDIIDYFGLYYLAIGL